jgi:hypothetical protein
MVRLLKKLGLRKVASRRVPHFLKSEQKELSVNISAENLQRYEGDHHILNMIIAIDETWIKSYDPLMPHILGNGDIPKKNRKNY